MATDQSTITLTCAHCGASFTTLRSYLQYPGHARFCSSRCANRRGTPTSRFWANVRKNADSEGCWLWVGKANRHGYGCLYIDRKPISAHRFSWGIHVGPIPPGLHVLHRCDTPACVNPTHLYLGTHTDNMRDRKERKHHQFGATHHKAKLTDAQVIQLRQEWSTGTIRKQDLAHKYGISYSALGKIVQRVTWRHLLP